MRKGKKETPTISPWDFRVLAGVTFLEPEPSWILRLDPAGAEEDAQASENPGPAGSLPLRLRPQPAKSRPACLQQTQARCTQHLAAPGLQQLLKPPPRESWEWGSTSHRHLRLAPPTSGSILSTAVLQRLGYVFRGEGDGQRGPETQAGGSLCWHTAL